MAEGKNESGNCGTTHLSHSTYGQAVGEEGEEKFKRGR